MMMRRAQLLSDKRTRLLRAVRTTYADLFDREFIKSSHMYNLKSSADRAGDLTDKPLCDFEMLQPSLRLGALVRYSQRYWFKPCQFPVLGWGGGLFFAVCSPIMSCVR